MAIIGKARYVKGYTTGSCADGAAKVAALMVLRQHSIHQVSIVTPSGVTRYFRNVESPHISQLASRR
ncbi:cobalt-precorrin-5B (C(1))-methyltransferase [Salmonella enterica subsp. enterica]|nr:cobalt-precorrin-5B (C(1))-methyltransferase [Salmonella enterica subsp. enterica]